MVGSGVAFVIPMLLLLTHGAIGASLSASDALMRRQKQSGRMDSMPMIASGELSQSKPQTKVERSGPSDYCDVDFVVGTNGTNDCTVPNGVNGETQSLITTEAMCRQAATEANGVVQADMNIHADLQNLRPKGCFQKPCDAAVTVEGETIPTCFFFNGNKETPGSGGAKIVGSPVCHRARFLNYVVPDTDTGNAGCPDGYRTIPTSLPCKQVSNCLADVAGDQFRVGLSNASKHLDYPLGCFIDKLDQKVYVNEVSNMGQGTSDRIKGTLICKVDVSSRDAARFTRSEGQRCSGTRTEIPGATSAGECMDDCAEDTACFAANFDTDTSTCYSCPSGFALESNTASVTMTKKLVETTR